MFSLLLGQVYVGYIIAYFGTIPFGQIAHYLGIKKNDDVWEGVLTAFIFAFGAIGAFFYRPILKTFSRRNSIIFSNLLAILGLGLIQIPYFYAFIAGRMINGFTLGLLSCLIPLVNK